MKHCYIQSSVIATYGYDKEDKILEIRFKEGNAVWQYLKVPQLIVDRFLKARSKGNFFVTHIKGNYPERRVN